MNPTIQYAIKLAKIDKHDDAWEILVEAVDRLYQDDNFRGMDELFLIPPEKLGLQLSIGLLAATWALQDRLRYYFYFLNRAREMGLRSGNPDESERILLKFQRPLPDKPRTTGSIAYDDIQESLIPEEISAGPIICDPPQSYIREWAAHVGSWESYENAVLPYVENHLNSPLAALVGVQTAVEMAGKILLNQLPPHMRIYADRITHLVLNDYENLDAAYSLFNQPIPYMEDREYMVSAYTSAWYWEYLNGLKGAAGFVINLNQPINNALDSEYIRDILYGMVWALVKSDRLRVAYYLACWQHRVEKRLAFRQPAELL